MPRKPYFKTIEPTGGNFAPIESGRTALRYAKLVAVRTDDGSDVITVREGENENEITMDPDGDSAVLELIDVDLSEVQVDVPENMALQVSGS